MFLPASREEMQAQGMEEADFILVSGDAYVDHPSFGTAIIGRLLQSHGFRVAVLAQPDWKDTVDIQKLGRPRLGFLVTGGNIDSMVNHYTVAKKRRTTDAYSPGGVMGKRPDRATVVYSQLVKRAYKDVPIIIGGVEASLRRMAHYDYWRDKVNRSILLDAQADLLAYGMAERSIVEIAEALDAGIPVREITFVRGTVYHAKSLDSLVDPILLPSYSEIITDKRKYAESFLLQNRNNDFAQGRVLAETYGDNSHVVQNAPQPPLTTGEFDRVYSLPYERAPHPMYAEVGGIPAIEEVKFSLIANRGCFGGCHFCALTFHQGRIMQKRSKKSLVAEAEAFTHDPDFKGYIHDVGGPTANFRNMSCQKQAKHGVCKDKQCMTPEPCSQLQVEHKEYLDILRALREIPKVKKVFIRSGIRFDYLMLDKDDSFFNELCEHHISGQLKVAPEHVSDKVLEKMGKTRHAVYDRFVEKYKQVNERLGKKQFLVPYLMSSHPGCGLKEAVELAEYLRDIRHTPQQVQDFYPTPSTLSTCMYHTGLDPMTMRPVYVPKTQKEKAMQRALMQYRYPQNEKLVREALALAGREDLVGFGEKCLLRPLKGSQGARQQKCAQAQEKEKRRPKKKTIRNIHKKAGNR
ncbi:YgiQ family radical SAM protein [Anaerotalea alkaliphila]|uniref:YgiQ family radical SAM protein n=1 Tax=Anaerotalea alkaliphila TaxID=2662126 RepID=A0A7X5HUJ0_9FIRM|nr:YgiQ family radical SAM protein [Anaerotalea alkaliphila]NDL66898.1 YgiQ family radical SAM protein [Anaerotalea alkaliphila]